MGVYLTLFSCLNDYHYFRFCFDISALKGNIHFVNEQQYFCENEAGLGDFLEVRNKKGIFRTNMALLVVTSLMSNSNVSDTNVLLLLLLIRYTRAIVFL